MSIILSAGAALTNNMLSHIVIIVVAAMFFAYIAKALKQPMLLAYIIAGLVIGNAGLGLITNPVEINLLAEIGIAFLLFSLGTETNFSKLKSMGKIVVVGGAIQIFFILLFSLIIFMSGIVPLTFMQSIYLALILAFSSTLIVVKVLFDDKKVDSLQGRLLIGFLLVQDFLVVIILPLLPKAGVSTGLEILFQSSIILILVFVILNKYVYKHILKFASRSNELLFLTSIALCFGAIGFAFMLNFPLAVGSFIAGISLSNQQYNFEIFSQIRGIRDFFATIFFVSLGMQITLIFSTQLLIILALMLFIVFIVKPLVYTVFLMSRGYGSELAFVISISLAQVSEFSFLLANQGYVAGSATSVLTKEMYTAAIIVTALSMVATPYLYKYKDFLYKKLSKISFFAPDRCNSKLEELDNVSYKTFEDHVVVIGAHTMGENILKVLKHEYPVVAVDHNPDIIQDLIKRRINAIYGDQLNEEIIDKVHIDKAKLLVITPYKYGVTESLVKLAKKENPRIIIFAQTNSYSAALSLYESGADYVIIPSAIASNTMLQKVAEFLRDGNITFVRNLETEFMAYLKEKAEEEIVGYKYK